MIVLVESNFVIEFAQRQSEIADAERIVTLAENHEIELAIPACALFEPYETFVRRKKQRSETIRRLRDEVAQLGRSEYCATVIPLSGTMLKSSLDARQRFSLQPQDSIIFSSVEHFLRERGTAESVFANKNSADFSGLEIKTHFEKLGCKLFASFSNARQYIESVARRTGPNLQ